MKENEIRVSDYLLKGEENAKPQRELVRELGLSAFTIKKLVQGERLAGMPICSSCRGYYIGTAEELREFTDKFSKEALCKEKMVSAMRGREQNV